MYRRAHNTNPILPSDVKNKKTKKQQASELLQSQRTATSVACSIYSKLSIYRQINKTMMMIVFCLRLNRHRRASGYLVSKVTYSMKVTYSLRSKRLRCFPLTFEATLLPGDFLSFLKRT